MMNTIKDKVIVIILMLAIKLPIVVLTYRNAGNVHRSVYPGNHVFREWAIFRTKKLKGDYIQ